MQSARYAYDKYYSERNGAASAQPDEPVAQQHDPTPPSELEAPWQPHGDYATHHHPLGGPFDDAIIDDAAAAAAAATLSPHHTEDPVLKQQLHHQQEDHDDNMPSVSKQPQPGGYIDSTYVLRIHEMLEDSEKEGNQDIVSWLPHGRAFRIHLTEQFVADIMPRYFKAKIVSFQRWLRAWGFCRMTEGKDRGAWYHRYFVRGVTNLCRNMTRQQMLAAMNDWLPSGQVPDFYKASTSKLLAEVPGAALGVQDGQLVKDPKKLRGTILEDIRAMLRDAEEENIEEIVSWLPHGRAFKVHDRVSFQKNIMPRYFKTNKLTHLSDTLRIWGFRRLKIDTSDKGAYFHKLFVRGNASLCRHRSRQTMKEAMVGWKEFDLYKGEPTPPTATELATATVRTETEPTGTLLPTGTMDPLQFTPAGLENEFQPQQAQGQAAPQQATANTRVVGRTQAPVHPHQATVAQVTTQPAHPTDHHDDGRSGDGTYVLRIHDMLEDSEKEGNQHIVAWQPHGRAFRINNDDLFVATVMPRYFKAKIVSFRRWLRAWGFCRMTEGKDRGSWYHRYFVRGVTSLVRNMTRHEMLKAMEDWLPAGQVPDFYSSGTGLVFSEKATSDSNGHAPSPFTKNPKRLRGTVLEDLRALLDNAEETGDEDVVSWLSHGRAFKIYQRKAFAHDIMPRYFRATKAYYLSDTLRIWGFVRLKKGKNKGAYFHRLFVKNRPDLTRHLSRQQMRDSMSGWPLPVEPDLNSPDVDQVIEHGLQTNLARGEVAVGMAEEIAQETTQPEAASILDEKPTEVDVSQKRKRNQWEGAESV